MSESTIRLDYDDDLGAAVDKINVALREHGLELQYEEGFNDGYEILRVANINPESIMRAE